MGDPVSSLQAACTLQATRQEHNDGDINSFDRFEVKLQLSLTSQAQQRCWTGDI